jgi:hypothetical protein
MTTRPFPLYQRKQKAACEPTAASVDKAHGRLERRRLTSTTTLNGLVDWPDLGQVFEVERVRAVGDKSSVEVVYGIASLGREAADARRLLALLRGHWGIENRVHWVRDVTLGEDASRIRTESAAEVMAGLRNAAISLLRLAGVTNIVEALRENLYHVRSLLSTLGILNL